MCAGGIEVRVEVCTEVGGRAAETHNALMETRGACVGCGLGHRLGLAGESRLAYKGERDQTSTAVHTCLLLPAYLGAHLRPIERFEPILSDPSPARVWTHSDMVRLPARM